MIIRKKFPHTYTVVPNSLIRDKSLTDSAGWLLVNLLSNSDDWKISVRSLASQGQFGSHEKIIKNLKLLRDLGYARLTRLHTGESVWDITDTKGTFEPDSENQNEDEPHSENQNKGEPCSENRNSENRNSENRNVLRNNNCSEITKGEERNPPKGSHSVVGFDAFWSAYPKKVNKPSAVSAFKKLSPKAELLAKIITDVSARSKTEQWTKQGGQFIPNPSTYLNQMGWENPLGQVNGAGKRETMDQCAKRMFGRPYDDLTGREMGMVDDELTRQRVRAAA